MLSSIFQEVVLKVGHAIDRDVMAIVDLRLATFNCMETIGQTAVVVMRSMALTGQKQEGIVIKNEKKTSLI